MLKLKFRKLHQKVVSSVNPASVIILLFQEDVISADNLAELLSVKEDPQQQCNKLLVLLHTSEHPQAFVHLYLAIKSEPSLQWLVEGIDKFIDQSVISLQQQEQYISRHTGMFYNRKCEQSF